MPRRSVTPIYDDAISSFDSSVTYLIAISFQKILLIFPGCVALASLPSLRAAEMFSFLFAFASAMLIYIFYDTYLLSRYCTPDTTLLA